MPRPQDRLQRIKGLWGFKGQTETTVCAEHVCCKLLASKERSLGVRTGWELVLSTSPIPGLEELEGSPELCSPREA